MKNILLRPVTIAWPTHPPEGFEQLIVPGTAPGREIVITRRRDGTVVIQGLDRAPVLFRPYGPAWPDQFFVSQPDYPVHIARLDWNDIPILWGLER